MVQYCHKMNAFSQEVSYKLNENYLEILPSEGENWKLEYTQITSIVLQYDPTRLHPNRYLATIFYDKGKIILTNDSYCSFGEYQEKSGFYRQFIESLHQKVANSNPNVIYNQKSTKLNYILSIFTVVFIVVALAIAIYFSWKHQFKGLVAVKVIVLLFALPYMADYLKKNRPQSYDPLNIPQEMLPK